MAMPFRTVLVPPLRRAIRPWHDLEAYTDLAKHLREIQPDVVHTHSSKAGILGRLAARRVGVSRIVHTIHGLSFDAYQGRLANFTYRAVERRAARWSDRMIAVCGAMAQRAAAAGLAPRSDIDVIYSGMDVDMLRAGHKDRYEVRRRWHVGPEEFAFLKVARLFDMKGHDLVLPAFAEVLRVCPRAVLVLAGEGVLRPRLEEEARRLRIADRVRFLGLVSPEEIPGLLWASDAVVHAGLREGLARVVPQAGICRRPVVTYNIGGASEVVEDGRNGFLVEPPAPGQKTERAWYPISEAMYRLASDPALAQWMGGQWSEGVLKPFDYRAATGQIMQVYEKIPGR
jgi:glycosyltransferase involved in cell wall biosynthesis